MSNLFDTDVPLPGPIRYDVFPRNVLAITSFDICTVITTDLDLDRLQVNHSVTSTRPGIPVRFHDIFMAPERVTVTRQADIEARAVVRTIRGQNDAGPLYALDYSNGTHYHAVTTNGVFIATMRADGGLDSQPMLNDVGSLSAETQAARDQVTCNFTVRVTHIPGASEIYEPSGTRVAPIFAHTNIREQCTTTDFNVGRSDDTNSDMSRLMDGVDNPRPPVRDSLSLTVGSAIYKVLNFVRSPSVETMSEDRITVISEADTIIPPHDAQQSTLMNNYLQQVTNATPSATEVVNGAMTVNPIVMPPASYLTRAVSSTAGLEHTTSMAYVSPVYYPAQFTTASNISEIIAWQQ